MSPETAEIHEKVKTEQFLSGIEKGIADAIKTMLGDTVQIMRDKPYMAQNYQSSLKVDGDINGKIFMTFSEDTLNYMGKKILGEDEPGEEIKQKFTHLSWEVVNVLCGTLLIELEKLGIDVNISPVKTFGKYTTAEPALVTQIFTIALPTGKSQLILTFTV